MSAVGVRFDDSGCIDEPRGTCPAWCPHHGDDEHEAACLDHELDFGGVPASHSPVVDKQDAFEMSRVGVGLYVDAGVSMPATQPSVTLDVRNPTDGEARTVSVYLAATEARRVAALLLHGAKLLEEEERR